MSEFCVLFDETAHIDLFNKLLGAEESLFLYKEEKHEKALVELWNETRTLPYIALCEPDGFFNASYELLVSFREFPSQLAIVVINRKTEIGVAFIRMRDGRIMMKKSLVVDIPVAPRVDSILLYEAYIQKAYTCLETLDLVRFVRSTPDKPIVCSDDVYARIVNDLSIAAYPLHHFLLSEDRDFPRGDTLNSRFGSPMMQSADYASRLLKMAMDMVGVDGCLSQEFATTYNLLVCQWFDLQRMKCFTKYHAAWRAWSDGLSIEPHDEFLLLYEIGSLDAVDKKHLFSLEKHVDVDDHEKTRQLKEVFFAAFKVLQFAEINFESKSKENREIIPGIPLTKLKIAMLKRVPDDLIEICNGKHKHK